MECDWNNKPQNCEADAESTEQAASDNVLPQPLLRCSVDSWIAKFQVPDFLFPCLWDHSREKYNVPTATVNT